MLEKTDCIGIVLTAIKKFQILAKVQRTKSKLYQIKI
jgi:hypothetical protein